MYRGKGNSNGKPHFSCGTNNAVYVAMDKIMKKHDASTTSEQSPGPSITQQPKPRNQAAHATAPATRSQATPATKAQTSKGVMDRVFDFLQLGGDETLTIEVEEGAGAVSTHNSKFKVNDRVIIQSVNEEVIAGTVRWVGPVRVSKDMKVDPVSVVGVETVSEVV